MCSKGCCELLCSCTDWWEFWSPTEIDKSACYFRNADNLQLRLRCMTMKASHALISKLTLSVHSHDPLRSLATESHYVSVRHSIRRRGHQTVLWYVQRKFPYSTCHTTINRSADLCLKALLYKFSRIENTRIRISKAAQLSDCRDQSCLYQSWQDKRSGLA